MRTDSTHILTAVRTLNRLECVGETLRHALNMVATITPDWLSSWVPADWFDRYSRRFEEFRLPDSREDRYAIKRRTTWTGYKVHLTESCDEALPHLIMNVETTTATLTDYEMTSEIQNHLIERDLLPAEHLVDSGYMSSDNLVDSQAHKVDLIGPVAEDPSWQA